MASKCSDVITHLQSSKDIPEFLNSELSIKMLKPLDDVLRCGICCEYFKNCMITKCSHNYCSLCIRRYMTYKSQCPTCFEGASEPELRNNRLIDEVLRLYIKIRENLQNVAQPEIKSQTEYPTTAKYVNVEIKKEPKADVRCPDKSEDLEYPNQDSEDVSCPVCYRTVLKSRINIHLDTCLKLKERERSSERKTLTKLVYHLLSDKDIKKKLKEHGLGVSGDRQTLIRRHKNFLTLYNANCDSLNPKPVSELVQEIEAQELEERLNSFPKQIQVNKKSDIYEIEKEHESYVKEHQSQFNALMHDVQQRHIDQIIVKQEEKHCGTESCGSQYSNIVDDFGNVIGESIICIGKNLTSDAGTSWPSEKTRISSTVKGKTKPVSEEIHKIELVGDIKQEPLSLCKIKEKVTLSKSLDKIQDSFTNESPPSSLDDYEIEHN